MSSARLFHRDGRAGLVGEPSPSVRDPIALQQVAAAQQGLVTMRQCATAGYTPDDVKKHVRSKFWARLARGVYLLDADLQPEPFPSRVVARAAQLAAGPEAAVVLHDAAELHGIKGLRDTRRVHLSLPGNAAVPRRLGHRDVVPHQFVIRPGDLTVVDGMLTTTVVRTLADLLLHVDRMSAVSALDSALFSGLVTRDDLDAVEGLMRGRRNAAVSRTWLGLADGRAESPLETRGRLVCVDARLPPDVLQAEIRRTDGTVAARADLLWSRSRLIAEADGAEFHDRPDALFRDRERQNELAALGYTVVRFTWQDTLDSEQLPRMIRRFL
ncbi:MAG: type IV toxin-antitoxin system AbiEi family antitoxin domain-containing protein [Hamadaea sp.]|nr:type IV toxin-antitoxin system AbiEi family antitoxin domain-containing protein [Hamadaea sp.]